MCVMCRLSGINYYVKAYQAEKVTNKSLQCKLLFERLGAQIIIYPMIHIIIFCKE